MKQLNFIVISVSILVLITFSAQLANALQPLASPASYMPPEGYVPNAKVAIEIAEIVAEPIYGKSTLSKEQPLKATLDGDVWIVSGTLPKSHVPGTRNLGGTLECRISKRTGQIMRMIHGQ